MLSLANVDYAQIGKGVVAFFLVGLLIALVLGIMYGIDCRVQSKKDLQKKREQKQDEFFFGSVKDWRTMK